jgi:hypothetical protein
MIEMKNATNISVLLNRLLAADLVVNSVLIGMVNMTIQGRSIRDNLKDDQRNTMQRIALEHVCAEVLAIHKDLTRYGFTFNEQFADEAALADHYQAEWDAQK